MAVTKKRVDTFGRLSWAQRRNIVRLMTKSPPRLDLDELRALVRRRIVGADSRLTEIGWLVGVALRNLYFDDPGLRGAAQQLTDMSRLNVALPPYYVSGAFGTSVTFRGPSSAPLHNHSPSETCGLRCPASPTRLALAPQPPKKKEVST